MKKSPKKWRPRLATDGGQTVPDPAVEDFIGRLFAELDALPRLEAAKQMRDLGATLPASPTAADFERAWAAVEARLRNWLPALKLVEALAAESGISTEEAITLLEAAPAKLAAAQARVAELEQALQARQVDALIAQGQADRKITPALEARIRAQIAAGDMTIKGAETMVANLAPIAALGPKAHQPPVRKDSEGLPQPTYHGQNYADLTPIERAKLKAEQPELYNAMRAKRTP